MAFNGGGALVDILCWVLAGHACAYVGEACAFF